MLYFRKLTLLKHYFKSREYTYMNVQLMKLRLHVFQKAANCEREKDCGYSWNYHYSWVSRDVINFTGVNFKSIHCHQTEKIFTVCVDLVFGSKYVQFREICLLQCSTIINTIWVDLHSELLKKVPVKPKNSK